MSSRKKIMIADDDSAILEMMTMMLELAGYEVIATTDGAAVLTIENNLPALLLLDIWMSGSDGRDICRQLKTSKTTQHLPVLLVSASRNIEASALAAGADGFIAKPFEMADFLAIVKRYISLPH